MKACVLVLSILLVTQVQAETSKPVVATVVKENKKMTQKQARLECKQSKKLNRKELVICILEKLKQPDS